MDDLKQRVAEAFRSARLRKGLTQEAVAEQAGVTVETISNSERAESLVSLPVFLGVAKVLEIDIARLTGSAPRKRVISAQRLRLERELALLGESIGDKEIELLIGIGRLLRRAGT